MASIKQRTALDCGREFLDLVLISAIAIAVRTFFINVQSGDYVNFLGPWFDQIQQNGGLRALAVALGDYNVSYLFIIAVLTYLPFPSLYSLKAVSILGDFVMALFAGKVACKLTNDRRAGVLMYALCLLWPEVVLNSSAWAQCDAIYTAGILACIYYLIEDKPYPACLAFGVSFAFKLQSIFFAPVLLIFLLKRKIRIRHLLLVPAVFLLSAAPAVLAGRGLWNILTIYFRQTKSYSEYLTLNAPSLVSLFQKDGLSPAMRTGITIAAILFCGAVVLAVVAFAVKKLALDTPLQIAFISAFFLLAVPWLLPRMHERYFYPAAVALLVCSAALPRARLFAALVAAGVLPFYGTWLFALSFTWDSGTLLKICAVILGVIVLQMLFMLFNQTKKPEQVSGCAPAGPVD